MAIPEEISTLVFDWGDTLILVDPRFSGVMADWPEGCAMPGAQAALAELHGRFRLVVATHAVDSSAEQIRAALARVGLAEYIAELLTFAELGTRKAVMALQAELAKAAGIPSIVNMLIIIL